MQNPSIPSELMQPSDSTWTGLDSVHVELWQRFGLAALLGLVVAGLYRWTRPPGRGLRGLASTVLVLAPLITMVTLAVGSNLAAAFTLVGTLAIVRFRTAIRDPQDTSFVIFSVAAGLAAGNLSVWVAVYGTLVVAGLITAVHLLSGAGGPTPADPEADQGRQLVVEVKPPDPEAVPWAEVVAAHGGRARIVSTKVDRADQVLVLRLEVDGLAADDLPRVAVELLATPEVRGAVFRAASE